MTVVIVEDSQALKAAMAGIRSGMPWSDGSQPDGEVTWATHSPYLVELLARERLPHIVLDQDITQDEADAIGYAALDCGRAIAELLDGRLTDWPLKVRPGWPLRHVLHRAATSYFYKAFLLGRLIARFGMASVAAVGLREATLVTSYNVMPNRFDTLFAVLAARMGLPIFPHRSSPPVGAKENGDYMQPSFWSRFTTLLNAPGSSLPYRLWWHALDGRAIVLPWCQSGPTVAVHSSNELVEEAIAPLLLRGARLVRSAPFTAGEIGISSPSVIDAAELTAKINALIIPRLNSIAAVERGPFAEAAHEIARRTVRALSYGQCAAATLPQYVDALRARSRGRPVVFLSNAMADGLGGLLREGLKNAGIRVVVAEHGVAPGLSTLHHAQLTRERRDDLVDTLFWTPVQFDHAAQVLGLRADQATVTGLPSRIRRIGGRRLQRHVVRRQLKVRRRLITWCTGLYPNNFQFLPHYWRDGAYHAIRKTVLRDVLGGLDSDVLLKLYPTYRYNDPDPLSDRSFLPPNVRTVQFADFRSLRAAADVMMIDGPGSVLGWSWSMEKPMIFLETGMYTLREEIRVMFEEAIFYIDVRRLNWAAQLRTLLAMPQQELEHLYRAKASRREKVAAYCILGPSGSAGARAADYVVAAASVAPSVDAGRSHLTIAPTGYGRP